jgi:hypothetical protein
VTAVTVCSAWPAFGALAASTARLYDQIDCLGGNGNRTGLHMQFLIVEEHAIVQPSWLAVAAAALSSIDTKSALLG